MHAKINLAMLAVAASLLIILLGGCASSASGPTPSAATPGAISVPQVPMTPYMRSQIGTPNELSPLAPGGAKNVHKVGDHWVCELNGQTYIFNGADWVPQQ
jgi:hypothetical protein